MNDSLLHYYERELTFFRQQAEGFAQRFPTAAAQLRLEPHRSTDPHVERLIQAFALLTGRVSQKLDDELPEVTHALLETLYPHYLRPFPSCAIAQLQPDLTNIEPAGLRVPRHSRLHSQRIGRTQCHFRTAYDVELWPLEVASCQWQLPPFDPALAPPEDCAAVLRVKLQARAGVNIGDLPLSHLRFFLAGERVKIAQLHELLLNHTQRIEFRTRDTATPEVISFDRPEAILAPVGFAANEELLPYSPQTFAGYRTLGEFFHFAAKYAFIDLAGWSEVQRRGCGSRLEVVLYVNRDFAGLEQEVDAQTLRLGCTPIVNLFEKFAEPIRLTQREFEYRVIPDVQRQRDMEVFSVERVVSAAPGATREYRPFYDFRRYGATLAALDKEAFWLSTRRAAETSEEVTSDVFLQFVDERFDPRLPSDAVLAVHTLCTNGDLPWRLHQSGHPLTLQLEQALPVAQIELLVTPSPTMRRPSGRHVHWRLIEHLASHQRALAAGPDALAALRDVLRLYCLADDAEHPQSASIQSQWIDSLQSLSSRRVLGRIGGALDGDFVRGVESTLVIDEEQCRGVGVLGFASVIERFLAASASVNSFHQLVVKAKAGERLVRRFPPRAGEVALV